MRRYRPKAPTAIHGPSDLIFLLLEKANVRKTMNNEWRLKSKLCLRPWMTVPQKK
jgi:hypothetical protein